jgi:hypothetical protein
MAAYLYVHRRGRGVDFYRNPGKLTLIYKSDLIFDKSGFYKWQLKNADNKVCFEMQSWAESSVNSIELRMGESTYELTHSILLRSKVGVLINNELFSCQRNRNYFYSFFKGSQQIGGIQPNKAETFKTTHTEYLLIQLALFMALHVKFDSDGIEFSFAHPIIDGFYKKPDMDWFNSVFSR